VFGVTKLKNLEHACTALSEADGFPCPLEQSCMGVNNKGDAQSTGSTWRPSHQLRSNVIQVSRPSHQRGSNVWGRAIISGSEQGARRGRICMWEDEVCTGVREMGGGPGRRGTTSTPPLGFLPSKTRTSAICPGRSHPRAAT